MYLDPLRVNVTQAAEALDVSRKHLSAVLNGRASVTPDMAIRLEAALKTDAEFWLNLQTQHDLWVESRKAKPKVKLLTAAA
jgi:addiction module HigA family antidote